MLLPDQTYDQCQQIIAPLKALKIILECNEIESNLKTKIRLNKEPKNEETFIEPAPENYGKTFEFFDNIPDYVGEPLGPFSLPDKKVFGKTNADVLKVCEQFLHKHRIRPDFFCRYRKALR